MTNADYVVRTMQRIDSLRASGDVASIVDLLNDRGEWNGLTIRASAARALGKMRAEEAVSGLEAALGDADDDVLA
jgi:HEAT repeat protein